MADTTGSDEERSPPLTIPAPEIDTTYRTSHLPTHIDTTHHHLTGAPEPPEPPYAPSFFPPTGYWTSAEKALFFHALSTYSRLRPDLIAASIGTKSTVDVVVYLALLREGASSADNGGIRIAREQYPTAYEVSPALVAFEDTQAMLINVAEATLAEAKREAARAEVVCAMRNGMRARRGEGQVGQMRDRVRQGERKEAFERWLAGREVEWRKEDLLERSDATQLIVMDRVLRLDEETRGEQEEEKSAAKSPPASRRRRAASFTGESDISSPTHSPHATNNADVEHDDPGPNLIDLSPASRRRTYKRLYMRRKRAEASGGVAQLEHARLKPGRKASTTGNRSNRHEHENSGDERNPKPQKPQKQNTPGETRPYKIQHELEELGIDAGYLQENGLGLFHLSALGRLMHLYPRLDASQPEGVTESIATGTIQALHTLVVHFTRDIVRRAIALRELDFALRGHTKVWRLGERSIRPPHVHRALELRGSASMSKRNHFGALLERLSEGDGSSEDDDDDDDDVPLAVRLGMMKVKAVVSGTESGEGGSDGGSGGEQQQKHHAGISRDAQPCTEAARRLSHTHRAMYAPFVYAPDIIAPAHPFGVYAPGTTPETLAPLTSSRTPVDEEPRYEDEVMPSETDEEALEIELSAEARLDVADARAAAEYEACVWRELQASHDGDGMATRLRRRKRRPADAEAAVDGADADADDAGHSVRPRKRRKVVLGGCGKPEDVLKSPDGVRVKSGAVIENSDSDSEYLG